MYHSPTYSTAIFAVMVIWFGIVVTGQTPVRLLSVFHINGKKPIHIVSDRFLSFTLDPEVLLHIADCPESTFSLHLFRSLAPAYLRIAGPDSNELLFLSSQNNKGLSDPVSSQIKRNKNMLITDNQWLKFNECINNTGLNIIVSLNGGILDQHSNLDLSNALEFITFSNKNNLNLDWQLGYEVQRIANDDGKSTGHDLTRLRKILEVFPRYQKSLILGPDMTNFESREDIAFIRNYLTEAQNVLNAFTLHPDFSRLKENDDVYEMLSEMFAKMDNYLWIKEGILKTASKGVASKKPIWIAESENKEPICKFSETLSLIKRLGSVAKMGASVYLRKPHLSTLFEPTPEFWVSVIYKALVGRVVLDMRLTGGNSTKVHAFSHCTQILAKPEDSIINPAVAYDRGSITIYGVNMGTEPSRISLNIGLKSEGTIHLYALTEDSTTGMPKTMLNKQQLALSPERELPMISPKIRDYAKYVIVPSRSVFFIVLPLSRSRACMLSNSDDDQDGIKNKNKLPPIQDEESVYDDSPTNNNDSDVFEDDTDESVAYVFYPKRGEQVRPTIFRGNDEKIKQENVNPTFRNAGSRINTKYITYSDDTWLSSFPDRFKEVFNTEQMHLDSANRRESKAAKLHGYKVLSRAMLGKRVTNATNNSSQEENNTSVTSEDFTNHQEDINIRPTRAIPEILEINTISEVLPTDPVPVLQIDMFDLHDIQVPTENFPSDIDILESISLAENKNFDIFTPQMDAVEHDTRSAFVSDNKLKPLLRIINDDAEARKRRNADIMANSETSKLSLKVLKPPINVEDEPKLLDENIHEIPILQLQSTEKYAMSPVGSETSFWTMRPEDSRSAEFMELNETDEERKIRANRDASKELNGNEDFSNDSEMRRLTNSLYPVSPFPRQKGMKKPKALKDKKDISMATLRTVERSAVAENYEVDPYKSVDATSSTSTQPVVIEETTKSTVGNALQQTVVDSGIVSSFETKSLFSEQSESEITSNNRAMSESKILFENSKTAEPKFNHSTITSKSVLTFTPLKSRYNEENEEIKQSIRPSYENENSNDLSSHFPIGLNIPSENRHFRKEIRAKQKSTSVPITKTSPAPAVRPSLLPSIKSHPIEKPAAGRSAKSASEAIMLANARLKELREIERARINELKEKILSRVTLKDRNTPVPRNKREADDVPNNAATREIHSEKFDRNGGIFNHEISSAHSINYPNDVTATVTQKSSILTTPKYNNHLNRYRKEQRTPSLRPRYTFRKLHTDSITPKLNKRVERDLFEDAFNKMKNYSIGWEKDAEHFYTDVSENMKRTLSPIAEWFEKGFENIKSDLSRNKRDVNEIKLRLKAHQEGAQKNKEELKKRRERIRVKLAEDKQKLHNRLVRDLNLMNEEEKEEKPNEKSHKKLENTQENLLTKTNRNYQYHPFHQYSHSTHSHFVDPRRTRKAHEPNNEHENFNRRVIFRLNLLKNYTAGKDSKHAANKIPKTLSLHKRNIDQVQLNTDSYKSLDSDTFSKKNDVEFWVKNDKMLRKGKKTDKAEVLPDFTNESENKHKDLENFLNKHDQLLEDVFMPTIVKNEIENDELFSFSKEGNYSHQNNNITSHTVYEFLNERLNELSTPTPMTYQNCENHRFLNYVWCLGKNGLWRIYRLFVK